MRKLMRKVELQLYANKYGMPGDNTLVRSVLDGELGFELVVQTEDHMIREILTLSEVEQLRMKINDSIIELERLEASGIVKQHMRL